MGLSPRLLIKSSFANSGGSSSSGNSGNGSASRTAMPSPPNNSMQSANSSLSSVSSVAFNDHGAAHNVGRIGPSPIATHSFGLYPSASFSSTQSTESCVNSNVAGAQQKSAEEILRIVSMQKLCVVRKQEAQEETLINSIVDKVAREADVLPLYLHVTQKAAGRLLDATNRNGLPLIYVNGDLVGGLSDLRAIVQSAFITNALRAHDYDLIVIGASAGGIAAATEASLLHKKVILLDVRPTDVINADNANETSPAQNYNYDVVRRLLGEAAAHRIKAAAIFKTKNDDAIGGACKTIALRKLIRAQTQRINERQKRWLDEAQVRVVNVRRVWFSDTHELSAKLEDGQQQQFCADKFLVALAGHWPTIPAEKNKRLAGVLQHAISTNEFFSKYILDEKRNCQKLHVLCMGDERRALEFASIASAFGYSITILRSPDTELINIPNEFKSRLRSDLALRLGVHFINGTIEKCEISDDGLMRLHIWSAPADASSLATSVVENYHFLINCDNSSLSTDNKALNNLKVQMVEIKPGGKTSVATSIWPPNVYTLNEYQNIKLARNLIRRAYDGYLEELEAYDTPFVISTPISYASCGLSIKQAIFKYGSDSLSVYSGEFYDISAQSINESEAPSPFLCKIICLSPDQERIIGAQLFAPDAALLIDFFGLTVKMKARRCQLDSLASVNASLSEILQCLTSVTFSSFS